jgi:hypothetical protein
VGVPAVLLLPAVVAAKDPRFVSKFDDDVLHELGAVTGRDLEVVDTTGLVNGP